MRGLERLDVFRYWDMRMIEEMLSCCKSYWNANTRRTSVEFERLGYELRFLSSFSGLR